MRKLVARLAAFLRTGLGTSIGMPTSRVQYRETLCENAGPLFIFTFPMDQIPPITCCSNSTRKAIAGSSKLVPSVGSVAVSPGYNGTRKFPSSLNIWESGHTELAWKRNLNRGSMPSSWGRDSQLRCQALKGETDREASLPAGSTTSIFPNDCGNWSFVLLQLRKEIVQALVPT